MVWVQNQRERAKQLECASELRELGIAYHNYHDTLGTFPTEADIGPSGFPRESIYTDILDFM
jgi:hypothetical protein